EARSRERARRSAGRASVDRRRRALPGRQRTAALRSLTRAAGSSAASLLHWNQSIETTLRVLRGRPLVPVAHRADPQRLVGVVGVEDVVGDWGLGIGGPIPTHQSPQSPIPNPLTITPDATT